MTFGEAVSVLRDGYAVKRKGWTGYVYMQVVVNKTDGTETETTKIIYKNKAGTEYVYTLNNGVWTAPSTTVPFDAEFHSAMIADDWEFGKKSDFDNPSGAGTNW